MKRPQKCLLLALLLCLALSLPASYAEGESAAERGLAKIKTARNWDAIVLPGGGEGTANLLACEALAVRLRRQKFEDGGYLCAICAAPTVLAAADVLDDEDVTCYPSCAEDMGRPIADAPAVADGQIITGRGPGAAITFALAVLAHLVGENAAHAVAAGMVTQL